MSLVVMILGKVMFFDEVHTHEQRSICTSSCYKKVMRSRLGNLLLENFQSTIIIEYKCSTLTMQKENVSLQSLDLIERKFMSFRQIVYYTFHVI